MKIKIIRNYNDANKLLERGHRILKIDRDNRNRNYLIFIFEETDMLIKDLKDITPVK